jgi:hypothetical protein
VTLKMKNLTPVEQAIQGEVEGRDEYLRANAPAVIEQYKEKIARQAKMLTLLGKQNDSLRREIEQLRRQLGIPSYQPPTAINQQEDGP